MTVSESETEDPELASRTPTTQTCVWCGEPYHAQHMHRERACIGVYWLPSIGAVAQRAAVLLIGDAAQPAALDAMLEGPAAG